MNPQDENNTTATQTPPAPAPSSDPPAGQPVTPPPPAAPVQGSAPTAPAGKKSMTTWLIIGGVVIALAVAIWYFFLNGNS